MPAAIAGTLRRTSVTALRASTAGSVHSQARCEYTPLPPLAERYNLLSVGSLTAKGQEIKREYGKAYPSGAETAAAPATVSGECWPRQSLGNREGWSATRTRKPGDLPTIGPQLLSGETERRRKP